MRAYLRDFVGPILKGATVLRNVPCKQFPIGSQTPTASLATKVARVVLSTRRLCPDPLRTACLQEWLRTFGCPTLTNFHVIIDRPTVMLI